MSAFLDLTLAIERLTVARLQLANAWARGQRGQHPETTAARNPSTYADDLQDVPDDLTDTAGRVWTDPHDW